MKRCTTLLLSLSLLLLLGACRKTPDLDKLSGNFVVQTDKAPGVAFTDYKTYYISDTMAYISTDPKDSILVDDNAKAIVSQIKSNMAAMGYTFVARDKNPDLGINTLAVKNVNVGVVYPGWWWGYPGYWDPWYWGWYYPYYYPWSVAYSVTTGSVIAELIDLKHVNEQQKLQVVWTMSLNGALGSSASTNLQRALNGIDQAFVQSPYLKTN
ncbi:uncharacterized protein DUF4136 [Chitinophaga skermanii]|uniref:Uncharacterized protein DUF4136 n=1 Tax=Chitinophaga skermanii TaxID=331697 RepID=A0A327QT49_9BACT|nr:DUF4136 domain-containing protein [Chitinophaga skermanii]RAJ06593.1 uncharacterized protein DUF4136 [Chitinophaga skermanii]